VRVKCNEDDTIGDLKKLVAAQTGTRPEKIRIQKWWAAGGLTAAGGARAGAPPTAAARRR
jgi:hypothetical protein